MNKYISNKKLLKFSITISLLIIMTALYVRHVVNKNIEKKNLLYCQEYVAGTGNIQGDVDIAYFESRSRNFAIGANAYGFAVFKNPDAAFKELISDYSESISLVQRENQLPPLSKDDYESYEELSDQLDNATDEQKKRAAFVTMSFS